MKSTLDRRTMIRTMVTVAVFCAVAYVCQFVFRIRIGGFLTFDAKDAVMAVGAMLFGPVWGLVMSLLIAFLEMITISETGWIGFFMNFISSAVFTVLASAIYRSKRTVTGAIVGLSASVIAVTTVMILWNLLLTPLYTNTSIETVVSMIAPLLLPFNLTKALLNAGLVLVLYKPISTALKKARLMKGNVGTMQFDKKSVAVLLAGILIIALCVVIFFVFLNGSFEWGNP